MRLWWVILVAGPLLGGAGAAMAAEIDWGILTGQPARTAQVSPQIPQAPLVAPALPAGPTCFIKSEQTSGQAKICLYDCLGSAYATNIPYYGVCAPQVQPRLP